MTEEHLLLKAILEQPGEDTPRVVYADWLDEHATPKRAARAEFVRVQCSLARMCHVCSGARYHLAFGQYDPTAADVPPNGYIEPCHLCNPGNENEVNCPTIKEMNDAHNRRRKLYEREAALLKKWGGAWLPKRLRVNYPARRVEGSTVWCDPLHGYVRFERGFIARVGCELAVRDIDAVLTDAYRFGAFVAALFRGNPLEGFTVSFSMMSEPALTALFELLPALAHRSEIWQLAWDAETLHTLIINGSAIAVPADDPTRAGLVRHIAPWLRTSIHSSAMNAIVHLADGEPPEAPDPHGYIDPDPDPNEPQEYEPGYD